MKRAIDYKALTTMPFIAFHYEMLQISNSQKAFALLMPKFNPDCEEFWLINLDTQLSTCNLVLIARGTLDHCTIHPRDLFREAVRANAYAMIVAHNHPSRDTRPTQPDIILTKRLCRLSRMLEIPILDHIVFCDLGYFSFKENNLI